MPAMMTRIWTQETTNRLPAVMGRNTEQFESRLRKVPVRTGLGLSDPKPAHHSAGAFRKRGFFHAEDSLDKER